MEWGEVLTRLLAQLAVACYLLRVLLDLGRRRSPHIAHWKRRVWTAGCAALWLHIAGAFHFVHDWSHADAVRQTAEQTRELTGWAWGGGVYINYAFAIYWLIDVILCWRRDSKSVSPPPARFWAIHAIFAFMMINATIVFGPAYWRYIAIAFTAVTLAAWMLAHIPLGRKG
jgi:hypothetical protein